jgi:hypothetical protein
VKFSEAIKEGIVTLSLFSMSGKSRRVNTVHKGSYCQITIPKNIVEH